MGFVLLRRCYHPRKRPRHRRYWLITSRSYVCEHFDASLIPRRLNMPIDDAFAAVKRFHDKIGTPSAATPRLLPGDAERARAFAERISGLRFQALGCGMMDGNLLLLRLSLALEELAEWLMAHANGDLVGAADAWADRAYALFGDAVAAGLPTGELFKAVHTSNLTKTAPATSGGKAVKGPGYLPPDIQAVLRRAMQQ
jgi:predicted HAD superfamily Cof-like phosphohydrolase